MLRRWLQPITPEAALNVLPWSALLASIASLGLIAVHAALQRRTDVSQAALGWALAAFFPALVLAFAPARPMTASPYQDRRGVAAWAIAMNAGLILMIVPVYSAAWQTDWDAVTGWRSYAYFNKRWLAAIYAVAVMSVLALPVWIYRWMGDADAGDTAAQSSSRRRLSWLIPIEVILLLGAAWYLAGPPWNIATHHRGIDYHEQVHLGPLQAISKGYVPYVGPASTQYGPGAQLVLYGYMSLSGQFNLVGFREAFLLIHLVTVAVFVLLARAHAGSASAWLVLFIGLICSPLKFFAFGADGSPGESFGWGNAARYLAAIAVVPWIGCLLTRDLKGQRLLSIGVGVTAGLLAWFAQENLASAAIGTSLLIVLLSGAGATTWPKVRSVGVPVVVGFFAVWAPLLAWYATQGQALQFINNYFIVPRAVAAGYQNTWFSEGAGDPYANAFRYTAVVAIAIGVLCLWDVRRARLYRLDRDRIRLLSFVCALLACYPGALYRSDSLHTLNVLLALPFVLVLAFRDLPSWTAASRTARAGWRAAIAAMAIAVYPLMPQLTDAYTWVLYPPSQKYRVSAPDLPAGDGVAYARATAGLADEPAVVGAGSGAMRQFLADASELHSLIGDRPTVVENAAPYFTGLVYFMANLTPAPYLYDVETMVISDRQQAAAWEHFQRNIDKVGCVIVSSTDAFEAKAFLSANPSAQVIPRRLGAAQIYVILNARAIT